MVAVQLRVEHASPSLELPSPYLLFLGDITEPAFAKTAFGLKDWAPDKCLGEIGLTGCTVSAGPGARRGQSWRRPAAELASAAA